MIKARVIVQVINSANKKLSAPLKVCFEVRTILEYYTRNFFIRFYYLELLAFIWCLSSDFRVLPSVFRDPLSQRLGNGGSRTHSQRGVSTVCGIRPSTGTASGEEPRTRAPSTGALLAGYMLASAPSTAVISTGAPLTGEKSPCIFPWLSPIIFFGSANAPHQTNSPSDSFSNLN